MTNYRPVYAPKDLLEVLLSLKGPHREDEEYVILYTYIVCQNYILYSKLAIVCRTKPMWEFSHISLHVKNLFDLRVHFSELIRPEQKVSNWTTQCRRVLQSRHAPLCQHLLKKGQTSTPYRGPLWMYVLGSQVESLVSANYIIYCNLYKFSLNFYD